MVTMPASHAIELTAARIPAVEKPASYMLSYILLGLIASIILGWKLWKIFGALRSPLIRIPGRWYAPWTTLHLRYLFSTGEIWQLVEKSHQKYGPIVRLGPRHIWVSDKECVRQALSTIDLPKVAMYAEVSRDRNSLGLFGEM